MSIFRTIMLATLSATQICHAANAQELTNNLPGNTDLTIADILPTSILEYDNITIESFDIGQDKTFDLEISFTTDAQPNNQIAMMISNYPQQQFQVAKFLESTRKVVESMGDAAKALVDIGYEDGMDCVGNYEEASAVCLFGNVGISINPDNAEDGKETYQLIKEIVLQLPKETLLSLKP